MVNSAVQTIPLIKPDLPSFDDLERPFREILANGRCTNFGKYVQQFESDASRYLCTHAVTVSSATAGLILTLQALEIPRGTRVAIPSFSFVATAQAVLYAGCIPVFIDVGNDGNADPADLAELLSTTDVHGVILVHMYGLPCRTEEFEAVVRNAEARHGHKIPIVYDAAHAFGSMRHGVRVGGSGDAEVFSTSVTKVMTTIEGGVISTRNEALANRLKKMRNYGIEANYDAWWPGLNSKMSEFHALVGIHNLARLEPLLESRAESAHSYMIRIHARTGFRVITPSERVRSTFKDFTIVVPGVLKDRRDEIIASLAERGIETRAYFFPSLHEQRYFRRFADRPLPRTEDLSRRVITLPFYSTISEDEMTAVTDALAEVESQHAVGVAVGERGL
jgi:dTDP-4-amino-4,6-dideoxygalactose transaminase